MSDECLRISQQQVIFPGLLWPMLTVTLNMQASLCSWLVRQQLEQKLGVDFFSNSLFMSVAKIQLLVIVSLLLLYELVSFTVLAHTRVSWSWLWDMSNASHSDTWGLRSSDIRWKWKFVKFCVDKLNSDAQVWHRPFSFGKFTEKFIGMSPLDWMNMKNFLIDFSFGEGYF